jgi:hypothetical protein
MLLYAFLAIGVGLVALRSIRVLGRFEPWTTAGWIGTFCYCLGVGAHLVRGAPLPANIPYLLLIALTIAFVVAAFRDERQAEPWYWPTHRGLTRAERRRTN